VVLRAAGTGGKLFPPDEKHAMPVDASFGGWVDGRQPAIDAAAAQLEATPGGRHPPKRRRSSGAVWTACAPQPHLGILVVVVVVCV